MPNIKLSSALLTTVGLASLLLLLLLINFGCARAPQVTTMPQFSLVAAGGGETINSNDFAGQVLLVNFLASG